MKTYTLSLIKIYIHKKMNYVLMLIFLKIIVSSIRYNIRKNKYKSLNTCHFFNAPYFS